MAFDKAKPRAGMDNTRANMIDRSDSVILTPRSGSTISKVASMNMGSDVSTTVKESPSPMFMGREAAPRNDVQ